MRRRRGSRVDTTTGPDSPMTEPAVELREISFSYSESGPRVLDSLSVCFPAGKVTAVVGANGSGKSTLLRIIAGQLIPTAGTLHFNGVQVDDDNVDELISNRVGMVFQNPESQFVSDTVRTDIAFGLENMRVPREEMESRIKRVAKDCGIQDFLDREPSSLSGGQKQRVALAGVLVRDPEILLLDEATAMLDPVSKRGIRELLERIEREREGLTVIQVTHDWREAVKADWLIAISGGRLSASGKPADILGDYDMAKSLGLQPTFETELRMELCKSGVDVDQFTTPEGLLRCLGQR